MVVRGDPPPIFPQSARSVWSSAMAGLSLIAEPKTKAGEPIARLEICITRDRAGGGFEHSEALKAQITDSAFR
jgi:hypothetical protein